MSRKKHGLNQRLAIAQSNTELLKALVRIVEEEGGTDDDLTAILSDSLSGARLRRQLARILVNCGNYAAVHLSDVAWTVYPSGGSFVHISGSGIFDQKFIGVSDSELDALQDDEGPCSPEVAWVRVLPFRLSDFGLKQNDGLGFGDALREFARVNNSRVAHFRYFVSFCENQGGILDYATLVHPGDLCCISASNTREGGSLLSIERWQDGLYAADVQLACLVYA